MGSGPDTRSSRGETVEQEIVAHLRPRAGSGEIEVHRLRNGFLVEFHTQPLALLKSVKTHFHLYWKRSSGRWIPYKREDGSLIIGSLDHCLDEMKRDPQGRFWK